MNPVEKPLEINEKILFGIEKAYEKLLEFKKRNNSELRVWKDNTIVRLKPDSRALVCIRYERLPKTHSDYPTRLSDRWRTFLLGLYANEYYPHGDRRFHYFTCHQGSSS